MSDVNISTRDYLYKQLKAFLNKVGNESTRYCTIQEARKQFVGKRSEGSEQGKQNCKQRRLSTGGKKEKHFTLLRLCTAVDSPVTSPDPIHAKLLGILWTMDLCTQEATNEIYDTHLYTNKDDNN